MTNPLPMSDVARAIASKEGPIVLKKLNDLLEIEIGKVERKKRAGLSKKEFEETKTQTMAINSAKLILKSIHLYHSAQ